MSLRFHIGYIPGNYFRNSEVYATLNMNGIFAITILLIAIFLSSDAQNVPTHEIKPPIGPDWPGRPRPTRPWILPNYGHCNGWGDVHYTSYDGERFDHQGVCRYVLSRDCCNNSWSIEVEQIHRFPNSPFSVSDKFTIRFLNYVIQLSKLQILEICIRGACSSYPGLSYDDRKVQCVQAGTYIQVALKMFGVKFRWNWMYNFDVSVPFYYRGKLCGICGDYNGHPGNDLKLTPSGEPVLTIPQWGESWRTMHQPDRCLCDGPNAVGNNPIATDCTGQKAEMDKCGEVMNGDLFEKCREKINVDDFIANCETEMCACGLANRGDCMCFALDEIVRKCDSLALGVGNDWKNEFGCGVCNDTDTGVLYQHGQQWRYKCTERECANGKIESNQLSCCEHEDEFYVSGQEWRRNCTVFTCNSGKVEEIPDSHCCKVGEELIENGHSVRDGCNLTRCEAGQLVDGGIDKRHCCLLNGKYYEEGDGVVIDNCWKLECMHGYPRRIALCCRFSRDIYNVTDTWTYKCHKYECLMGGRINRIGYDLDCKQDCVWMGQKLEDGKNVTYGCNVHECIRGRVHSGRDTLSPKCIQCTVGFKVYKNGTGYTINCYKYECDLGAIKYSGRDTKNATCMECRLGGKAYKNGTELSYVCNKYQCVNGSLQYRSRDMTNRTEIIGCNMYECENGRRKYIGRDTSTHACTRCRWGDKVYENSEMFVNYCYNYTCVNGTVQRSTGRVWNDPNGVNETFYCYKYLCQNGRRLYKGRDIDDPECTKCRYGSDVFEHEQNYTRNCIKYQCLNGMNQYGGRDNSSKCMCVEPDTKKQYGVNTSWWKAICHYCYCNSARTIRCSVYGHRTCPSDYVLSLPCTCKKRVRPNTWPGRTG